MIGDMRAAMAADRTAMKIQGTAEAGREKGAGKMDGMAGRHHRGTIGMEAGRLHLRQRLHEETIDTEAQGHRHSQLGHHREIEQAPRVV